MEILEAVREYQHQLKNSDEESSREILGLLKTVSMTFEVLKETKIAKTIKRVEKKYSSLRYLVRDMIDK